MPSSVSWAAQPTSSSPSTRRARSGSSRPGPSPRDRGLPEQEHTMVSIALREPARARLDAAVLDYFPIKLTVMDRDILLPLVDRTLDYLRAAGLTGLAAGDILRLTPDGMEVDVAVPGTASVSARALYQ